MLLCVSEAAKPTVVIKNLFFLTAELWAIVAHWLLNTLFLVKEQVSQIQFGGMGVKLL
jgi:hypothetical protein